MPNPPAKVRELPKQHQISRQAAAICRAVARRLDRETCGHPSHTVVVTEFTPGSVAVVAPDAMTTDEISELLNAALE